MNGLTFSNPRGIVAGKGHLSQMATVRLGEVEQLVVISGQVAWDENGTTVGKDSFRDQFVQVYRNLATAMADAGGSMEGIFGLRTYLTDPSDLEEFHRLRHEFYPTYFPSGDYPTNTLLMISRLAEPELRLEVEAMGVVSEASRRQ